MLEEFDQRPYVKKKKQGKPKLLIFALSEDQGMPSEFPAVMSLLVRGWGPGVDPSTTGSQPAGRQYQGATLTEGNKKWVSVLQA